MPQPKHRKRELPKTTTDLIDETLEVMRRAEAAAVSVPPLPLSKDDHLMVKIELGQVVPDREVEIHTLEPVPADIARRFVANAEQLGWMTNVTLSMARPRRAGAWG